MMGLPMMAKWGLDVAKAPAPVQASLEPIIRFFSYHDAHPIAMTMVLMEKFGVDWFEWEPECLKEEILTTFRATSISEHNWQKLQAVRTLTSATGFWEEWQTFEKIIQALNNNIPRFDIGQRCTMAQLMAGVDIANTIRHEEFEDEVQRYIAACAVEEGVWYLPPPIDFAQGILSEPALKCRVCGNEENDVFDDHRCSFCCGRFQDEHPLNMKPNPKLPGTSGTNVERFLVRDPSPTEKRFNEVKLKDPQEVDFDEEKREDVQAAKLVVAYKYMQLRNRQLNEQLEELKSWVTH